MTGHRTRLLTVILWCGITLLGWVVYAPALTGTFLLDDMPNLSGLASVTDWQSALIFSFSGGAGPLGRPLALLTFVPQAESWGQDAEPFLRVNILIHLANACLLAWILHRLAILRGLSASEAAFAAIAGAALWMFMPLLASASLLIIQRMTTLAAFFVLLGIAGYLFARSRADRSPTRALIGMSAALIAGTALAVLVKENGALLPVFVLVMEATLLKRPQRIGRRHWQVWRVTFLVVPAVFIVGFLVFRIPYSEEVVLQRGFTGWERLLTECRVLWQYLFNAFIPQPWRLGPFHDSYDVARSLLNPVTLAAVAGWVSVLVVALAWRRRYALFSFAVLWFLGGHLLESTLVPLDLYFEHRNYLPVVGPVFALCAGVATATASMRRIVYAGLSGYAALHAIVLLSVTSLWGSPAEALTYWKNQVPDSRYAVTAAFQYQLSAEGPAATLRHLQMSIRENPAFRYLKLHELMLSCRVRPGDDHTKMVDELGEVLPQIEYTETALSVLTELTDSTDCAGITNAAIGDLALALNRNPRYKANEIHNHSHHKLMALIQHEEGRPEQVMTHLKKAAEYKSTADLALMIVLTYIAQQDFDGAYRHIEQARADAPLHPLRRYVWHKKLDDLSDLLTRAELSAR